MSHSYSQPPLLRESDLEHYLGVRYTNAAYSLNPHRFMMPLPGLHVPCCSSLSITSGQTVSRPRFKKIDRQVQLSLPISSATTQNSVNSITSWFAKFRYKTLNLVLSVALTIGLSPAGTVVEIGVAEAKVGVNKPELLPKVFTPVIDVAGFLSDGQEKRLAQEIDALEKDTGYKLRVLAQNYPDTPGLAIKDFWQVDDRTIVFVADPTFGNILNFNVGASIDLDIPRSFWSRLAGKYGNIFYWKEKGEDSSIEATVAAISTCLREPVSQNNCSEIK